MCLSSFRKIKTKNKNPTYLPIFFRSIIWEPEFFFCMALYPPQTKFWGVYRNHPVCLSVCLSVCSSCPGHNFLPPHWIWVIFPGLPQSLKTPWIFWYSWKTHWKCVKNFIATSWERCNVANMYRKQVAVKATAVE